MAGSSPAALALARELALVLGMEPFEIDDEGRAAYHAAASMASNFLLALEAAAERVAGAARPGARRRAPCSPRSSARTVENWIALGPERALTGPVARGDELTVQAQRAAVEAAAPDLLPLFDSLLSETRSLAGRGVPA